MGTLCAQPADHAERLGVLGIFTSQSRSEWRSAARASWMHADPDQILSRFVVRGRKADASMIKESSTFKDIAFVDAPADAGRKSGPLLSQMRWLQCAGRAWPHSRFIGKADDDIWAHLPSVADHLLASANVLHGLHGRPNLVWGFMETAHWDAETHRPSAFGLAHERMQDCRRFVSPEGFPGGMKVAPPGSMWRATHSGFHGGASGRSTRGVYFGPFLCALSPLRVWRVRTPPCIQNTTLTGLAPLGARSFAKGPLWFLSSALALAVGEDTSIRTYFHHTLNSLNDSTKEAIIPWEDVWLGAVLAQRIRDRELVTVHIGSNVFAQTWGLLSAPSVLLWHARAKAVKRIGLLEQWARRRHCQLPRQRLVCHQAWTSCGGATWRRCEWEHNCLGSCSTSLVGLGGRGLALIAREDYDRRRRLKSPMDCALHINHTFRKELLEQ
jgi:hypothetical protein